MELWISPSPDAGFAKSPPSLVIGYNGDPAGYAQIISDFLKDDMTLRVVSTVASTLPPDIDLDSAIFLRVNNSGNSSNSRVVHRHADRVVHLHSKVHNSIGMTKSLDTKGRMMRSASLHDIMTSSFIPLWLVITIVTIPLIALVVTCTAICIKRKCKRQKPPQPHVDMNIEMTTRTAFGPYSANAMIKLLCSHPLVAVVAPDGEILRAARRKGHGKRFYAHFHENMKAIAIASIPSSLKFRIITGLSEMILENSVSTVKDWIDKELTGPYYSRRAVAGTDWPEIMLAFDAAIETVATAMQLALQKMGMKSNINTVLAKTARLRENHLVCFGVDDEDTEVEHLLGSTAGSASDLGRQAVGSKDGFEDIDLHAPTPPPPPGTSGERL